MIIKSSTFRAHIGVDPNSNQIAYLVKEVRPRDGSRGGAWSRATARSGDEATGDDVTSQHHELGGWPPSATLTRPLGRLASYIVFAAPASQGNLKPTLNQTRTALHQAAAVGELQRSGALALRYASLAAERGVRAAAAALGHAFATGGGVGEGALDGPCPALAVRWLRAALGAQGDGGAGTVADAAAEGVSALSLGYPSVITANIAMARSASSAPGADELSGSGGGAEDDESGSGGGGGGASGTAGASSYNSWGGEVEEGGLEEGALCALRGPSGVGRAASQVETVEQAFALLAEAEAEVGGTSLHSLCDRRGVFMAHNRSYGLEGWCLGVGLVGRCLIVRGCRAMARLGSKPPPPPRMW
jgi:hypothetical protein